MEKSNERAQVDEGSATPRAKTKRMDLIVVVGLALVAVAFSDFPLLILSFKDTFGFAALPVVAGRRSHRAE